MARMSLVLLLLTVVHSEALTECQHQANSTGMLPPGAALSTHETECNSTTGLFERLQCRWVANKGICWCVHPLTGAEIEDTHKDPVEKEEDKPDCEKTSEREIKEDF